jgi:hypothetical protein
VFVPEAARIETVEDICAAPFSSYMEPISQEIIAVFRRQNLRI